MRFLNILVVLVLFCGQLHAQEPNRLAVESVFHVGNIVRNYSGVASNKVPYFISINPCIQTGGKEDWHRVFGFPRVGCRLTFGYLGNSRELGNMIGFTPNMTFKSSSRKWYAPAVNLGLGLAWFNKPYNEISNPLNYYIGSHITAMAEASVQIEPRIGEKTSLLVGLHVMHCSNSHYQVPNLGINIISLYMGILINPGRVPSKTEISLKEKQKSPVKFNIRSGIGIHELARTLGPAGTPKYIISANDFYVSKLFGRVSNVHAGLEVNYYSSYYRYTVDNDLFQDDRKLKSTVVTAFIAHELMIKRVSLLTQGGINLYNKFYRAYISQYKSEQGASLWLKEVFSTRLGLQYYLFDPAKCTHFSVFVGAYIKANFGQADFACFQMGVVL